MKKYSFILSIIAAVILSGCADLKYNEVSQFDEEWIFHNQSEVNGLLAVSYGYVRHGLGDNFSAAMNGAMLASASDESDFAPSLSDIHRYYNGAWSSINAFPDTWLNSYAGIYAANNILEKMNMIDKMVEEYQYNTSASTVSYEQVREIFDLFPYQARFLRAFFLFELARTYGDIPLVSRTLTPAEANLLTPSPVQEVFRYIVDECDAIAGFLPISYADYNGNQIGRVNRPTVLALKARTLLYAASPLFKPANAKEAWRKAAVASKELIDYSEGWGISLSKYSDLWSPTNFNTVPEVIWFRSVGSTNVYARYNYPVGNEAAQGGNCPSQNLVDAYEYTNAAPAEWRGKSFGEVHPESIAADAYENLDPRFGLTVAKNGDTWPTVSPYNAFPLEIFEGGRNGSPTLNATKTGYYLKKYVNGSNRIVAPAQSSQYTWVTYRLGEFYLNYAEAMFNYMDRDATKTGEGILDMSANDAINVMRDRPGVGMPLFGNETNGNVWEERYMGERMVELAFEGHRFWDIRRWQNAPEFFSAIKTIKVARDGSVTRGEDIRRGAWDDKYYFYPIPYGELVKAQGLVQNPGW